MSKPKTDSETPDLKTRFVEVKSLEQAIRMLQDCPVKHPAYQHYTSLCNALEKIAGKWYLTRNDCDRLNDSKEACKYGTLEESARIFQTSFCQGRAEDVAMWGMYQRGNPLGIRISIPGSTMKRWMDEIMFQFDSPAERKKSSQDLLGLDFEPRAVNFNDVIYAAVKDSAVETDEPNIHRTNSLYWNGENVIGGIEDLALEVRHPWVSGWVKDYEWRHERESRICVYAKSVLDRKSVAIKVPDYVVSNMRFTLSPWLPKSQVSLVRLVLQREYERRGLQWDRNSDGCRIDRCRVSYLSGCVSLNESSDSYRDVLAIIQTLNIF